MTKREGVEFQKTSKLANATIGNALTLTLETRDRSFMTAHLHGHGQGLDWLLFQTSLCSWKKPV